MKLLYVTAAMPFGSSETFLAAEAAELLRQGCELLIVPRAPEAGASSPDAVRLQQRAVGRPLLGGEVLLAAAAELLCHPLRSLQALTPLFRSRNVTTLAKNLLVCPKGLWIARLARRWGAEHIHAHWLSTPATMAMIASRISGVPWSCTAHRVDIALDNLLDEKVGSAQFVRFISESGRRMAEGLGARLPDGRCPVIHMGVVVPEAASTPPANLPPVLLCPANLYPVKGHACLLQAMALLKQRRVDCTLRIAGEGGLRPSLEEMAGQLALNDTVEFLGQVRHDSILGMYRDGRVGLVVLPSLDLGNNWYEGVPVSLMEAMAYGVPVLSTMTGGIPELLGEGAGLLVPAGDPSALADAIQRFFADPALRRKLAEAGRRRIEEGWTVQSSVSALLAGIAGGGSMDRPAKTSPPLCAAP